MRIIQNPAIESILPGRQIAAPIEPAAGKPGDFASALMDVLKQVSDLQSESAEMQTDYQTGQKKVDVQDVMIAVQKASTAMDLTLAVRNKLLEAYQEINRMQV